MADHWPARNLTHAVSQLYAERDKYSDVEIQVEATTFKCHKLILALHSPYFQQCLFPANPPTPVLRITLNDISPVAFEDMLRYLYTGKIDFSETTVESLIRLAYLTQLDVLAKECWHFMRHNLGVERCVSYWQVALDLGDSKLQNKCEECFSRKFVETAQISRLEDITRGMMEIAIKRYDLNVESEVELCEVLLKWLDANRESVEASHRVKLLSSIRWSGVSSEYIELKMKSNGLLKDDRECVEYLEKVALYRSSGIQFPGLRTHHRPSTGLETSVVIVGVQQSGDKVTSNGWRISLQRDKQVDIEKSPPKMQLTTVACTDNSSVYLTGLGNCYREMWRWDAMGAWTRGPSMNQGRRGHSAIFVNRTSMYALGGWSGSTTKSTPSVEQFNTLTNIWRNVGQLAQPVYDAGCVAYETSIYLFGGGQGGTTLDCIQDFDTITGQCTLLTCRLGRPLSELRAVLWDTSVILMNQGTCLVFDLNQKTIEQRDQFAAGVTYFGLALDNEMLFIIGGGTKQQDNSGKVIWTCSDEINYLPVMDIISNNRTANWSTRTKLKKPSLIHGVSIVTQQVLPDKCQLM